MVVSNDIAYLSLGTAQVVSCQLEIHRGDEVQQGLLTC